jgi:hypothetical protein
MDWVGPCLEASLMSEGISFHVPVHAKGLAAGIPPRLSSLIANQIKSNQIKSTLCWHGHVNSCKLSTPFFYLNA